MADRGVSDLIGFILIFSLIAISVGTVYVVGFSGLQDARNAEQLTNTERAFDVLADNIDDIVRSDAPNRATEFRLYEADLAVGERTTLTVEIANVNAPNTYSVTTYPLVYKPQRSSTTIRYLNGAVIRQDRGGALFLDDPTFVFRKNTADERTTIIPIIETRSGGRQAVGGTGTVLVRAQQAVAEPLTTRTTPSNANSDVDSDDTDNEYEVQLRIETSEARAPIWRDYLNEEIEAAYPNVNDPCSLSNPATVECTFPTERLYVTVTRIDIALST